MSERGKTREENPNSLFGPEEGWTKVIKKKRPIRSVGNISKSSLQQGVARWWMRVGTSVFVDNVPDFYDGFLLKKLFRGFGSILDCHLPRGRRLKTSTRYGFVVFQREVEVLQAVRKMNGVKIFGQKLSVKVSFNGKVEVGKERKESGQSLKLRDDKFTHDGRSFAEVLMSKTQKWVVKTDRRRSNSNEESSKASTEGEEKRVLNMKLGELELNQKEQLLKLVEIEKLCRSLQSDLDRLLEFSSFNLLDNVNEVGKEGNPELSEKEEGGKEDNSVFEAVNSRVSESNLEGDEPKLNKEIGVTEVEVEVSSERTFVAGENFEQGGRVDEDGSKGSFRWWLFWYFWFRSRFL